MIYYLIGRAGTGKTRAIYQQIKQTIQTYPQAKCILLVPELFTLQAERDLIQFLGDKGLLQAEILSFNSLARRVLEDVGAERLVLLSPLGKILLLKKILLEQGSQLYLYGQAAKRNGILEQLSETLEELKREGITPEDLRRLSQQSAPTLLQRKLHDLAFLEEQVDQYMEGHYWDTEAKQRLILSCIPRCSFLKNTFIWVDGFSGFTTPNLQIMECLFDVAQDVTLSFTMDLRENIYDGELFAPVRYSWEKVRRRVKHTGNREGKPTFFHAPLTQRKSAPLRHLEQWAFAFPVQTYQGKTEVLALHETESPYAEVVEAARQILTWAEEKHLRWREIGVVVFQLETYAPLIERVFREYGIPGFLSRKRTMMHQPIVQFLLATLDSVRKNMRFDDVFAAFKTGLGLFTPEIYEELENYCLAWGIEGRRWQKPFTAGEPDRLEQLNQWREEFVAYTQACFPALRQARTYGDFTRGLYQCLENLQVREKLFQQIVHLRQQGEIDLSSQIEQAWNYTIDIMDQLVEFLGEQTVSALQYAQVLQSGMASVEISVLPDFQDQVVIEDMQQALMPEIQALWVMGFHDGVLPTSHAEKGVLLPVEKEFFRDNGQEINLPSDLKMMQEYYHVYQALTRAQQEIHFSYALSDGAGMGHKPAIFLEQLVKIFPGMQRFSLTNKAGFPPGREAIFPLLVDQLCKWRDGEEPETIWKQIYAWYRQQPLWRERIHKVEEALFYTNQPRSLTRRQAQSLYGQKQVFPVSISRMESYARCPFSQLVQYGLRPVQRKEFSMRAPDIGDYMHLLLERYGQRVQQKRLRWQDIKQQECEAILQEVLDEIPRDYGGGIFEASFGGRYLQRRLNQMFSLSAWMLTCQIGRGEYEPFCYELQFGRYGEIPPVEITLQDGQTLLLEGRIDRVDIFQAKDEVWLRIIDYKTGIKTFQLSDLYYGLGIQLALYAVAMLRGWKQMDSRAARLAGMFFFRLNDPWLDEKKLSRQDPNIALLREFRLNGLLLKEDEVIQKMDRELKPGTTSDIIPAGRLKDHTFSAHTTALVEEAMWTIFDYVTDWLQKNAQEMLKGKCDIFPYNDGKGSTSCIYCPYHAICQFDLSLPDNQYHWLRKLDDKTVMHHMKRELQKEGKEE